MDDLHSIAQEKDLKNFQQAIGTENDPIILILRGHLFTENLLERLITFKLPRGDKVIENGNFSYYQKIILVESLNCISDPVISVLRNLNKLRNQCAHELDKKISENDISRLGSPLGKQFTQFKREAKFEETILLRMVINYICGYLTGFCQYSEHPELISKKESED